MFLPYLLGKYLLSLTVRLLEVNNEPNKQNSVTQITMIYQAYTVYIEANWDFAVTNGNFLKF